MTWADVFAGLSLLGFFVAGIFAPFACSRSNDELDRQWEDAQRRQAMLGAWTADIEAPVTTGDTERYLFIEKARLGQ